ncbi:MurR/RpiR family transcriptional regulator [Sediminispirochaeta bajacaliforniensis]|uniref:MurR/RpiR family transcriptional regulator n=1 Tax=Sediminispirochaeta bajacaliforniensis TaxID=148 RepID=UPI000374E1FC|nr:MurR/RpiR family transcriptional regulator [Sediminispirochaeta bajacaliforniensis]
MDILEQIKSEYPNYNSTRKRIASFILENPTRCCFLSLKEFAEEARSTEVTVLNFCRSLGLGRYVELKKALQSHVLIWTRPADRMKALASRSSDSNELFDQVVKSEQKALRATFEHNGPKQILSFIQMIRKARRVFVAAHGASRIFSSVITYRLSLLGVDISELDMDNPHKTIFRLLSCNPAESLLIAIATPPYGKSTIATTRMCRSRGIPVVTITDSTLSPLVAMAETALICPTELMGLTNSPTSIMAIIDIIAVLFLAEKQEDEFSRQEAVTQQYEHYLKLFNNEL